MADRLRLFVAVDPPAEMAAALERTLAEIRSLAPAERWSRPDALHLTLAFLGHLPADRLEPIRSALATVSAASDPFPLRIRGAGFFGQNACARVLWLGADGGRELLSLQASLVRELAVVGHREDRPFRPHFTLARARDPRGSRRLADASRALAAVDLGSFLVREFVLYRSELGPNGSRYTALAIFPLGAR